MIARLRGTVVEKQPTRIIVEVGGVGYDVHVPLSSYSAIGDPGSSLVLRVHTHVREDVIQLFGFASALEQLLFERLIGISGIGPRLALSVLSGLQPSELAHAIAGADVGRLTAIPGIGKKTAERIVLELKDKLGPLSPEGTTTSAAAGPREDLVSALVNLGYHRPAAEKVVDHVLRNAPDTAFEEALRSALRALTR